MGCDFCSHKKCGEYADKEPCGICSKEVWLCTMENWDEGKPHPPCGCADNGIICKDCYFDGKNGAEIQQVKKRFREEHEEDEYLSALFTIATLKNIDFGALRKMVDGMERSQGNKKAKPNDHEPQTVGDVEGVEVIEILDD